MLVALTRLRLRSLRFLPAFIGYARASYRQALNAPGCRDARLRKSRGLAFWTLTLWDSWQAMHAYTLAPPHRAAMPKLPHWCDEAAVAHWTTDAASLPTWPRAAEQLARRGRLSRVNHPSAEQSAGRINTD